MPADDGSTNEKSHRFLGSGTLVGRYRIIDVIGSGGMGVIYRAQDPSLDRTVALKHPWPKIAADPKAVARRLREDPALSQTQRRVALDLLLIECSRADDPESQSFLGEPEALISGTSDTKSTTQPSQE